MYLLQYLSTTLYNVSATLMCWIEIGCWSLEADYHFVKTRFYFKLTRLPQTLQIITLVLFFDWRNNKSSSFLTLKYFYLINGLINMKSGRYCDLENDVTFILLNSVKTVIYFTRIMREIPIVVLYLQFIKL